VGQTAEQLCRVDVGLVGLVADGVTVEVDVSTFDDGLVECDGSVGLGCAGHEDLLGLGTFIPEGARNGPTV
jgi:hypothetical protein